MKLENQVCKYLQATRLKELGIIQDGYYSYAHEVETAHKSFDGESIEYVPEYRETPTLMETGLAQFDGLQHCCAFTVAELGAMLPSEVDAHFDFPKQWANYKSGEYGCELTYWKAETDNPGFGIAYRHHDNINIQLPKQPNPFYFPTEAEARAEMLIYLLANNHITTLEINNRLQFYSERA